MVEIATPEAPGSTIGGSKARALPESHAFGIGFSAINSEEFFNQIEKRVHDRNPQYIVTPNLDFARLSSRHPSFRRALKNASMRLCDGAILYHLLKLKGRPVPEKLSGSDLTPEILQFAVDHQFKVYLFGSDEETLQRVQQRYGSAIVGWDSPPFRSDLAENDELNSVYIDRIRQLKPDLILVALGAPKQELWAQRYHRACGAPLTLCIGASLDFIGDRARRSPKIVSTLCLEWAWRLAMEPGRLWRRYLSDAVFLLTHFSKC